MFRPQNPPKHYFPRTRLQRTRSGLRQLVKELPLVALSFVTGALALALLPLGLALMPLQNKPQWVLLHGLQQAVGNAVITGVFMLIQNPVASYFRVKQAAA